MRESCLCCSCGLTDWTFGADVTSATVTNERFKPVEWLENVVENHKKFAHFLSLVFLYNCVSHGLIGVEFGWSNFLNGQLFTGDLTDTLPYKFFNSFPIVSGETTENFNKFCWVLML